MELVVISGKGGTGKTTIAAALSEMAGDIIRVDCDVDAPDLFLFYEGNNISKTNFYGGKKAYINTNLCIKCNKCEEVCKFNAIAQYKIDTFACEGCGACKLVCQSNAIKLIDTKSADIYMTKLNKKKYSNSSYNDDSIISRAEMEIGSDGSGKLISKLRLNAKKISENKLIINDGSPGIGCPVISSITGCDMALVITEPTKSGFEDMKRVISLCKHFEVKALVCINKYDINKDIGLEIEDYLKENDIELVGKIPYDDIVMKSINELKPIIYYEDSKAAQAIKNMWFNIKNLYIK